MSLCARMHACVRNVIVQFEDDDDSVDLPAGHMMDAEEVESTLAPLRQAPVGRSRALATQYKLDQLEKQRDLQAQKRKQKMGGATLLSSKDGAGSGGGAPDPSSNPLTPANPP
jgi:hypothetical protein